MVTAQNVKLVQYQHVDITKRLVFLLSFNFIHSTLSHSFFFRPFTLEMAESLKQPNSMKTFHKQIFAVFHQKGILYRFAHDFNQTGGFHAWWNELYGLAQKF